MKRFCVVTIIFVLIVSAFIIPSFAENDTFSPLIIHYTASGINSASNMTQIYSRSPGIYASVSNSEYDCYGYWYEDDGRKKFNVVSTQPFNVYWVYATNNTLNSFYTYEAGLDNTYNRYYSESVRYNIGQYLNSTTTTFPIYNSYDDGMSAFSNYIENVNSYTKNANVDEFLANTLISMGITFNSYSDALLVAQSAWDYIIDENNWYIGSGDRNDKDIIWDIDNAVSYANAQSNNYLDWYNGYKLNKDLTVALTKFIGDNYTASSLGQGTLAGYSVYYNSSYSYGSSGGSSGFDGTFGSSPNALSFYPANTITYFNGTYLHDNDVIDLDEFVYSPADVRKFIAYPDASGTIIPPSNSSGSGVITDGNGDTVYNIDLDLPSLDWLADAIQAVLDFLNRLITTIADFLTQILDAILSLFSDAFEGLTEFGQGIIEWLYNVVGSLGTLGSNYIPSDLWTIILPFIYLNVGIAILMFVLRSH